MRWPSSSEKEQVAQDQDLIICLGDIVKVENAHDKAKMSPAGEQSGHLKWADATQVTAVPLLGFPDVHGLLCLKPELS